MSAEEKTKQLEEQIKVRLQSAAEKREIIEKELQEKLKEQVKIGCLILSVCSNCYNKNHLIVGPSRRDR